MAADRILIRPSGIRLRITAVAAIAVGVALTVGAVLLVGLLRSRLDAAATNAATLRAQDVAALATTDALPPQLALPGEETAVVQVVAANGDVVASSENIHGEPAITAERPPGTEPLVLTSAVRPLDDNEKMRIVALDTNTSSGVVAVYAAESLERADETTRAITTVLLAGVPVLVTVVAGITWWAVGRTLRPVRAITNTMAEITASDLQRRVPAPTTRDEIGQLAGTVNDTLGRLETAVDRQRRFVADASHELRGPLTALRSDLEISITHPEKSPWNAVARDTLGDVERLQQLSDDLLLLARIDAEGERPRRPVDLAALTQEAAHAVRRPDIDVGTSGLDDSAMILGDEQQLRRMARNLIHNAEAHAQSRLDIAVRPLGDVVRLTVVDDGPGIPPALRSHVFERFFRLDSARTRDSGGAGLGLAIVHDVVTSHHGRIEITETYPHGATFTLDLPRAERAT
ncbi:MAG TPA: ATP-binding protein [Acidimicrobiales bacterium]|nr:ATP-binding protein [Acidimicrobiales bacterium]